jgi:cytochrome c oxidase assembly factor CtaG
MFVYISQVSVVQKIISIYEGKLSEDLLQVLLGQFIQLWEHSTIAFINNYAYAILGIPSVLFGFAIYQMKPGLSRITGLLLIISAFACLLGIIGIITGNQVLANGSAFGGGLFFLSLIGMSIIFWKD